MIVYIQGFAPKLTITSYTLKNFKTNITYPYNFFQNTHNNQLL